MMGTSDDAQGGGWRQLPVHMVETHGADGVVSSHLTAECPRQERVVTVEECLTCPRCGGLSVSGHDHAVLECSPGLLVTLPPMPAETGAGAGTPFGRARVADAMTRDVVCVRPETSLDDLTAILRERDLGGVPVVDGEGRPVGVVGAGDLVRRRQPGSARVSDVMRSEVPILHEGAALAEAAGLMAWHGAHRIPIVAAGGTVVGIMAPLDIVTWLARQNPQVPALPPTD